jgi:hypothetical protein
MFTPEEVWDYSKTDDAWADTSQAAAICLGRSPWLQSFAPTHLERCSHYRIMFYDEFLDIICEGVEAKEGAYLAA